MYRYLVTTFLCFAFIFRGLPAGAQTDAALVHDYSEKGIGLLNVMDREGLPWLRQALAISDRSSDSAVRHAALPVWLNLSRYYMLTGNYDTAKGYYNELLLHAIAWKNRYFEAKAIMGLGVIADYQSDFETSVTRNQEALRYFESIKDTVNIASALGNIGNSYIRMHSYQEAMPLFNRAISLAATQKEKKLTANLMSSLARLYKNMGDKARELEFKLKAYAVFKEINYTKGIATVTGNLGNYYENANDLEQSLKYYRISLASSLAISDQGNIAIMYNNVSDLYFKLGQPEKAMDCIDSALYYTARSGDRLVRSDALLEKAVLLHAAKRYDEAVVYRARYIALRDSIFSDKVQLKVADMHVKYETESKEQQIRLLNQQNSLQLLRLSNQELLVNNKQSQIIQQQQRLTIAGLEISSQYEKLYRQSLLTQQKNDSILALKKRNLIQDLELSNSELQNSRKNLIVALCIVLLSGLLLLGVSLYRRYTFKRAQMRKESEAALQLAHMQAAHDMQHEKLRIGRELHDNIGSHLTFVNTYLEQLSREYAGDRNITEARSVTLNTLKELRNAIWLISQEEISLDSFVIKTREYLQSLPAGSITATLDFKGDGRVVMRPETATHLFRILQESVNNAVKYSGADALQISIVNDTALRLLIADNGKGFDATRTARGNGLDNMEERAAVIHAAFSLDTAIDKGTRIEVVLPPEELSGAA